MDSYPILRALGSGGMSCVVYAVEQECRPSVPPWTPS